MSRLERVLSDLRVGAYRVTLHAKQRMAERNVSHADIRCCAENGIMALQLDGKLRVTGADVDGDELTLICVDSNGTLIVTVF